MTVKTTQKDSGDSLESLIDKLRKGGVPLPANAAAKIRSRWQMKAMAKLGGEDPDSEDRQAKKLMRAAGLAILDGSPWFDILMVGLGWPHHRDNIENCAIAQINNLQADKRLNSQIIAEKERELARMKNVADSQNPPTQQANWVKNLYYLTVKAIVSAILDFFKGWSK